MPVTTDDLRTAVTSLYPDNASWGIDATEQQGCWGNIYWSGAWQLNAGTPTKPIAGRSISADFRWDGAGWQQI